MPRQRSTARRSACLLAFLVTVLVPSAAAASTTTRGCTSTKPVTHGRASGWHIRTGALTASGQLPLRGADGRQPAKITAVSRQRRNLLLTPRRAAVARRVTLGAAGKDVRLTAALTRHGRRGVVHVRLTLRCSSPAEAKTGSQPASSNANTQSQPPATPPPTGGPCGPTVAKPGGGNWTCTFDDEFDGTALDANRWQVMQTAVWGFTQAGECYGDDPSNVAVADGMLSLTATKLAAPAACGQTTSSYRSGMIFTKDRFAQTYGRFEARLKMPSGIGLQPAFWLWPQDMAYGNRSGEIDIAEAFGSSPDIVSPHIHMLDAAGTDHPQGAYCHVTTSDGAFHTYTLEWSPTTMTFTYDGQTCWTLSGWTPEAPLVAPQPFDKPFFITLQLALGQGANTMTDSTPFPARLTVDYVRAWK